MGLQNRDLPVAQRECMLFKFFPGGASVAASKELELARSTGMPASPTYSRAGWAGLTARARA
jgi:hypothetical protein